MVLYTYCRRWRLAVITAKTKVIVFKKEKGYFAKKSKIFHNDTELEIVSTFPI